MLLEDAVAELEVLEWMHGCGLSVWLQEVVWSFVVIVIECSKVGGDKSWVVLQKSFQGGLVGVGDVIMRMVSYCVVSGCDAVDVNCVE